VSGLDMRQEQSFISSQVGRGRVISVHLGLRNAFSGDGGQKKGRSWLLTSGSQPLVIEVIQPSLQRPAFSYNNITPNASLKKSLNKAKLLC
jgi:hypothetical protein